MISYDEIDHLKAGTLHLDCYSIDLRNHDGTRTIAGPGYIRQQGTAGFRVTVIVPRRLDFFQTFNAKFEGAKNLGALLPAKDYWSMVAVDSQNRRWTAERISNPEPHGSLTADGHLVSGHIRELVTKDGEERPIGKARAKMQAFTKVEFPRNDPTMKKISLDDDEEIDVPTFNSARFEAQGFEFKLSEDDDALVLIARSDTAALHPHFESRVSEALLFVLGTLIPWSVVELYQNGMTTIWVRPPKKAGPVGAASTPIIVDAPMHARFVWRMYDLYLSYVWRGSQPFLHPLSTPIYAFAKTGGASVEARALTVVVEVEALLDKFFQASGKPSAKMVTGTNKLLKHVKGWDGDAEVKRRALGALGQLKSTRPGDRLRDLVARNVVSEPLVQTWSKLRNSVAHGDWSGVENLQQFIDDTAKVTVLFYQLVFHVIGYEGEHTDWGTRGWPIVKYPPSSNPPAPAKVKI